MILSNTEIVRCMERGLFDIGPLVSGDPAKRPFNTSSIDLRLADEILIPDPNAPIQMDLRRGHIANFLQKNSTNLRITKEQPFSLEPNRFVLARTLERVSFPLNSEGGCFSARVEGKSSLARCGILVHFTAPTIHAGFNGSITLEIINLGPHPFLLPPDMAICQLVIEEVKGMPADAPSQFRGQSQAAGVV